MKKLTLAPGTLERHDRREFKQTERRIARSDRRSRAQQRDDSWSHYLLVCLVVLAYSLLAGVLVGYLDWSLTWGAMR